MNSSTSSFKTELKVVAAVLLVLLGIEVIMRKVEARLSVDIAHIRSADQIAGRVATSSPSLLLLGNSLTRDGVLVDRIRDVIGEGGVVEAYYPDGSSVNEWAFAFRRYFGEPGAAPEMLVIGAGRAHLFDAELPPDSFGAYYCATADIPRYFEQHVESADDAAGFFLARYSAAYSNRFRVQPRLFTSIVPHYQEVLPTLRAKSDAELEKAKKELEGKPEPEREHKNLAGLLLAAKACGTRVVVLAIPMPEPYELPAETLQAIADGGATLVDARDLEGLTAESFPDNYHLGPEGAEMLTKYLIEKLQPLWWPENSNGN